MYIKTARYQGGIKLEVGINIYTLIMKIPWRRERLPTPVFLPGEFRGQRSLEGYSPWSCKELDTTEQSSQSSQFVDLFNLQVLKIQFFEF